MLRRLVPFSPLIVSAFMVPGVAFAAPDCPPGAFCETVDLEPAPSEPKAPPEAPKPAKTTAKTTAKTPPVDTTPSKKAVESVPDEAPEEVVDEEAELSRHRTFGVHLRGVIPTMGLGFVYRPSPRYQVELGMLYGVPLADSVPQQNEIYVDLTNRLYINTEGTVRFFLSGGVAAIFGVSREQGPLRNDLAAFGGGGLGVFYGPLSLDFEALGMVRTTLTDPIAEGEKQTFGVAQPRIGFTLSW